MIYVPKPKPFFESAESVYTEINYDKSAAAFYLNVAHIDFEVCRDIEQFRIVGK